MKLDLKTAEWLVDKMENDRSVFPIGFEECEKCGAAYIPNLGHDCNKVIEVQTQEYDDEQMD